ncbi:uncharacterized protein LOC134215499 [Armigeres subalbatus]|uniref:uncharacterized protein LOC134215499 n=1 Tax=Armigeres subalbatus TaxID=124917 RepID=UPI002ED3B68E
MKQIKFAAVLVIALILSASMAEARRVRRQQPIRSPFTTYFPSSQKFVRNQASLSGGGTFQSARPTFLTSEAFNDLVTTVQATRSPNLLQPSLEPQQPNRSREFYICMTNCLTLSHYNPVCGTDHTTYHNVYKLECSNRCGARPRVQVRKPGIC